MRISILIFNYTIHFAYPKVYTKFHNPKKCPICVVKGVTEGKNDKKGKMNFSIFFIYKIHLSYLKVYTKFENTDSKRSREIVKDIFIGKKEK